MESSEANATKMHEQLKDITECCICTEPYKDPRMLPCIHTFCRKCLETAGSKSNKKSGETMPCPLCRRVFVIPPEGFDGIQKNFFMVKLTDMTNRSRPWSVSLSIACDACSEDNEPTNAVPSAQKFCEDCCLKLCETCCLHHRRSKLTRNHKLVAVEDEPVGGRNQRKYVPDVCEKHDRECLKIHCSDCKKVVCPFCYIEGHQGHSWSDVNKAADEFRSQIRNDTRNLNGRNSELQAKIVELDQLKETIIRQADHIELVIYARRLGLKKLVDTDSDALILELASLKDGRMKDIETEKDHIGTQLTLLESFEMYNNEFIAKGSASDICRSVDDLKSRAVELQHLCESAIQRTRPTFRVSFSTTQEEYLATSGSRNIVGQLQEEDKDGD